MSKIVLAEQASAPDTPASGKAVVYADNTGVLSVKDDAGNVTKIGRGQVLTAAGIKPASDSTSAIQLQKADGTAVLTIDTTNSQVIPVALGVGVAASLLQRPAAGVVRQALESASLANDGTLTVSASNVGFVFLINLSDGATAIFSVAGGAGTLIAGSSSVFTGTSGTSSRMNVYASGSSIVVQNKLGSSKLISVHVIG